MFAPPTRRWPNLPWSSRCSWPWLGWAWEAWTPSKTPTTSRRWRTSSWSPLSRLWFLSSNRCSSRTRVWKPKRRSGGRRFLRHFWRCYREELSQDSCGCMRRQLRHRVQFTTRKYKYWFIYRRTVSKNYYPILLSNIPLQTEPRANPLVHCGTIAW